MKARPNGVETENTKIEAEFDSAPDDTRLPRQYQALVNANIQYKFAVFTLESRDSYLLIHDSEALWLHKASDQVASKHRV